VVLVGRASVSSAAARPGFDHTTGGTPVRIEEVIGIDPAKVVKH
jgi:hypothetical protein